MTTLELHLTSNTHEVRLSKPIIAQTAVLRAASIEVQDNDLIAFDIKFNHILVDIPFLCPEVVDTNHTDPKFSFMVGSEVLAKGTNLFLKSSHLTPNIRLSLKHNIIPETFTITLRDSTGDLLDMASLDLHMWIEFQ